MAQLIPVDLFDLIIFGGNGDLSLRKLMPALYRRDADAQLPAGSRIIAVGRRSLDTSTYLNLVREALERDAMTKIETDVFERFAARIHYLDLDATDLTSWNPLAALLAGHENRIRAIYLATLPTLYGQVAQGFVTRKLMTNDMRIILEKPVGHDYTSAREINAAVCACFPENQVFRIDHYLGKETVQNLLALRFANSLFEPIWCRGVIDHVQITVAEELGVGNRVEFYDRIGTLRDMVQNHLLQLLCLVAMEPPSQLEDDAIRDEKLKVLRALKPIRGDRVHDCTVRGQYSSGAIGGALVPGYEDELGQHSTTETFVALKVEIDNWRWSGVPFYLRTGKRLPLKHSEITILFEPVPHSIFAASRYATLPNRLSIMVQPDEGVQLRIMAKEPGPGGFDLRPVSLDLSFAKTFGARYPDAYERLLIEVLRGNPALFMRRDEIETAWQWVDGILAGWESAEQRLERYVAGTWGPSNASLLLDRDGRHWETGS